MRYNTVINNVKALEWGLNIQQAYLFAWFYELPSWSDKLILGDKVFYFASKNKAVSELPILTDKIDTMYRYYKQIESLGLVEIVKIDGKDYIYLTSKAKEWNMFQSDNSEKNPNELGNKSENNSEKNPTYNNNNINNNTINNKNNNTPKYDFKGALLNYGFDLELVNEWLEIRKLKKGRNSEIALKGFIREVELSKLDKNFVLRKCVEKNWLSFEASWISKQTPQQPQPHQRKIAL